MVIYSNIHVQPRTVITARMCHLYIQCFTFDSVMVYNVEHAMHRVAKNIILYSPYLYTYDMFFELVGRHVANLGKKENGRAKLAAFVNDILLETGNPADRTSALVTLLFGCGIWINEACDYHHYLAINDNSDARATSTTLATIDYSEMETEPEWVEHQTDLKTFAHVIVLVLETKVDYEFFKDNLLPQSFGKHVIDCPEFKKAMLPVFDVLLASENIDNFSEFWREQGNFWINVYLPEMDTYQQYNSRANQIFFRMLTTVLSVAPDAPDADRRQYVEALLKGFKSDILNDSHYDKEMIIVLCTELILCNEAILMDKLRAVNMLASSEKGLRVLRTERRFRSIRYRPLREAISTRRHVTYKVLPGTTDEELYKMMTPMQNSLLHGVDASNTQLTSGIKHVLAQISDPKYLVLHNTNVTDEDLEFCYKTSPGLKVLDLSRCASVTDRSLFTLLRFRKMKLLNITRTSITRRGFLQLKLMCNPFVTRILYAKDPRAVAIGV